MRNADKREERRSAARRIREAKEIIIRLSHIWIATEDGRRVWCDTNAPLSHRSEAPARLRTGNAWNGVRAIVHKIRISSARDDPPATVPAPSNIRGRMDINLPIHYRCIDIPGRCFRNIDTLISLCCAARRDIGRVNVAEFRLSSRATHCVE